jgi:hypothetical protein
MTRFPVSVGHVVTATVFLCIVAVIPSLRHKFDAQGHSTAAFTISQTTSAAPHYANRRSEWALRSHVAWHGARAGPEDRPMPALISSPTALPTLQDSAGGVGLPGVQAPTVQGAELSAGPRLSLQQLLTGLKVAVWGMVAWALWKVGARADAPARGTAEISMATMNGKKVPDPESASGAVAGDKAQDSEAGEAQETREAWKTTSGTGFAPFDNPMGMMDVFSRQLMRLTNIQVDIPPPPETLTPVTPSGWRRVAFIIGGVLAASFVIKFLTVQILIHTAPLALGAYGKSQVALAVSNAQNNMRYQEIMGYSAALPAADAAAHLESVRASAEWTWHLDLLWSRCNIFYDGLLACGAMAALWAVRDKIKPFFRALRSEVRANYSTVFRALAILLITDILVGFHSKELWYVLLEIVCQHYGIYLSHHHHEAVVVGFVSIVPVVADVWFKFWILANMQTKTRILMDEIDG